MRALHPRLLSLLPPRRTAQVGNGVQEFTKWGLAETGERGGSGGARGWASKTTRFLALYQSRPRSIIDPPEKTVHFPGTGLTAASQPVRGQRLFLAWFASVGFVNKAAQTAALLRQPPATAFLDGSFKGVGELDVDHTQGCVHACAANDKPSVVCVELRRTFRMGSRHKTVPTGKDEIKAMTEEQMLAMTHTAFNNMGIAAGAKSNVPSLPALDENRALPGAQAIVMRLDVSGAAAAATFRDTLRAVCDAASANAPAYYPRLSVGSDDFAKLRAEPDAGSSVVKSVGVTVGLEYEFKRR